MRIHAHAAVPGRRQFGEFPQQFPAYPGMEVNTSFLKWEYILEKLEDVSDGG